jgi:hypothetical protein
MASYTPKQVDGRWYVAEYSTQHPKGKLHGLTPNVGVKARKLANEVAETLNAKATLRRFNLLPDEQGRGSPSGNTPSAGTRTTSWSAPSPGTTSPAAHASTGICCRCSAG